MPPCLVQHVFPDGSPRLITRKSRKPTMLVPGAFHWRDALESLRTLIDRPLHLQHP
jgi:hypothetical protein